jgi:hypothetical protein
VDAAPAGQRSAKGRTPQCLRCGRAMVIGRFVDRKACSRCAKIMREDVDQFALGARVILAQSSPESVAWRELIKRVQAQGVPLPYALQKIHTESVAHLERFLKFCFISALITTSEIQSFQRRVEALQIDQLARDEMQGRLDRGYTLTQIRMGNLPKARVSDVFLDSDEQCHIYVPGHYDRPLQSRVASVSGHLLITDKKFRFVSHGDGWELAWTKITNVKASGTILDLYATQKKGSGRYHVKDAEYVGTVVSALTQMTKRQIIGGKPDVRDTATIPQHIKTAVFQRDRGKCRECNSNSYLEFDHIIPRSKGGATSEQNLQLLCRGCNQRKGSRI